MKPTRLIVVSNRIPLSFHREAERVSATASSGGLVSALEPILKQHGGVWVGSAGTVDTSELRELLDAAGRERGFHYVPVFLTDEEQTNYYEGFSNEVLWPLFHDLQDLCHFNPVYWDFYEEVNRKFADAIGGTLKNSDVIWVQDYQLLRVARAFRQTHPHAFVSFFLHIPFPPPDIFAKLPWRRQILEGLLEYDAVGLQTARDERNLVASIRSYLPRAKVTGRGDHRVVVTATRTCALRATPISIDFKDYEQAARSKAVVERMHAIRQQLPAMQIALGIDRLDYTKGIPERLRAFRVFLRSHPEFRRKITFIQVVVPSREGIVQYQDLRSDIERLVSTINGEFSETGWIPVEYMHRSVPRDELLALYRAANIALVTPLKDGMNLVAKEFCAAHVDNDGVLILSEFAGAMPELRIGALIVHPYDEIGMAAALRNAMNMNFDERHRRMLRMRQQIRQSDILRWRDRVFQDFNSPAVPTKLAA